MQREWVPLRALHFCVTWEAWPKMGRQYASSVGDVTYVYSVIFLLILSNRHPIGDSLMKDPPLKVQLYNSGDIEVVMEFFY
jgi:hypothetical protein